MYFRKKFLKYILIIIIIILIFKFLYNNYLNKIENLTLTEYTTVYSDAIKKKIDILILNSQALVNTLNTDTNNVNANLTNTINSSSITTTTNDISTNRTILTTKITDIQNTINGQTASQTALNDNQNLITKFNSNINISAFNIISNNKLNPKTAYINTKLIPTKTDEDNLYTISYLSYGNLNTLISNLNSLVLDAQNQQNKLSGFLPQITSIQNTLSNIKTSIDNLKSSSLIAQTSSKNSVAYSNTNDVSIIANALGDVFLNAQKNVDDTLKIKNQAILDTQNAINRNVSSTELQKYKNAEKLATDNYDKSNQTLNFLLNPDSALTNLTIVSEIVNVKNSIDKINMINNMILYFINNTKNNLEKNSFTNLLTDKTNTVTSSNTSLSNINTMFSTNIQKNKTDSVNFSTNILTTCNNIITQINNLETTNNTNFNNINNLINNTNTVINNSTTSISTFQSQIKSITSNNKIIKNNLDRILAYKVQRFSYLNVYNNWYNTSTPYFLGYITGKGILKKIYFFVNIYSWNTCIASETYFRILVKNEKTNVILYDKNISIVDSPDMTIEILDDLNVSVDQYCSVNFAISGSFYLTCSVESSNLQIQVNVDTYQPSSLPIMSQNYISSTSQNWSCIASSSSGKYVIGFVSTNSGTSNLYNSSDFGKTWQLKYILNDDGGFNCAISASGQYQIGTDFRSASIIISKDYGVTFSKFNTEVNPWGVSISLTGQYISIITGNNNWGGTQGPLYLSNDYGTTWTIKNIGNINNASTSISSDGKYQTVVSVSTIYKSSDYGNTFKKINPLNFNTNGNGNQISISETGQYQLISSSNSLTYGLWRSNDYGETWKGMNISDPWRKFGAVCISTTSQYQCVSSLDDPNFNLYISQDYGITWNGYKTPNPCVYLSISSENNYIYAVCRNNIVYGFSI